MVLKRISCAKPVSGLAKFNYSAFILLCCAPVTASNRCVRQSLHVARWRASLPAARALSMGWR